MGGDLRNRIGNRGGNKARRSLRLDGLRNLIHGRPKRHVVAVTVMDVGFITENNAHDRRVRT